MYPARDTLQHVIFSMVEEGGITEGGKNTASFLFHEQTQQHKHEASS